MLLKLFALTNFLLFISAAAYRPSFFMPFSQKQRSNIPNAGNYTIHYYEQQVIDHFTYESTATYKQRYLEQIPAGWSQTKDPVFIYCGNEAEIFSFYDNSGFLTQTLYQKFNARIVFLEHRYFGDSMPFGNASYTYPNSVYLTVNQALADLVQFLRYYKQDILGCSTNVCPKFIAFGGSYGGMLAAWLRMKFPNVIDGAISSSGPILYFKDQTPPEAFNKLVTSDYTRSTKVPNCVSLIRQAYQKLYAYSLNSSISNATLSNISSAFNLCPGKQLKTYQDISTLLGWIETAHTYMAMVSYILTTNYPYETTFLQHLPGWPCNHSCEAFSSITNSTSFTEQQLLTGMYKSALAYYNYYGTETCLNIFNASASIDNMSGWDYLACTMVAMPISSQFGTDDFFPPSPWNQSQNTQYCQQTYGLTPRYNWPLDYYGGRDDEEFAQYSNIFFANGQYDPWSTGGVLRNITDSVVAFYMDGAAHHLDLRLPNVADPPEVTQGRNLEMQYISKWIGAATAEEK